jgi:hypothetical protein
VRKTPPFCESRASRSSFHTISVSPCSSFLRQRSRAGRFVVAPDSPSSLKTVWHPAFFNAASLNYPRRFVTDSLTVVTRQKCSSAGGSAEWERPGHLKRVNTAVCSPPGDESNSPVTIQGHLSLRSRRRVVFAGTADDPFAMRSKCAESIQSGPKTHRHISQTGPKSCGRSAR